MNMTIEKDCAKAIINQASEGLSVTEKSFLINVAGAMQKVRRWGSEDAQAGKPLSPKDIYDKLVAKFEDVDPCFAQGIAGLLSDCYAKGVEEVTA